MDKIILWLTENTVLVGAIIAILWVIVKLTPTEKDDNILKWIEKILDWLVPARKKGGGFHTKNTLWNIFKKKK